MPAPTNAPTWASELALSYESGAASQFILYGNVHDRLAVGAGLVNLADYLEDTLLTGFSGVVILVIVVWLIWRAAKKNRAG